MRLRAVSPAFVVVAGAIGIVWLLAVGPLRGSSLATPPQIVEQAWTDGLPFYAQHVVPTVLRAAAGYVLGNAAGIALASLALAMPRSQSAVTAFSVTTQSVPVTALGPVLLIVAGPQFADVVLAGLLALFPTVVATIAGGRALSQSSLDLARVNQAGPLDLLKLRLHAALPSCTAALVLAIPAAMLGAVLGEYFGGISTGLGVAVHAAQYQMSNARMWGLSLAIVAITLVLFGVGTLFRRALVPWSPDTRARA